MSTCVRRAHLLRNKAILLLQTKTVWNTATALLVPQDLILMSNAYVSVPGHVGFNIQTGDCRTYAHALSTALV